MEFSYNVYNSLILVVLSTDNLLKKKCRALSGSKHTDSFPEMTVKIIYTLYVEKACKITLYVRSPREMCKKSYL